LPFLDNSGLEIEFFIVLPQSLHGGVGKSCLAKSYLQTNDGVVDDAGAVEVVADDGTDDVFPFHDGGAPFPNVHVSIVHAGCGAALLVTGYRLWAVR